MADGKTAFQKWYERNKDLVNSARRKKYHTDPEYRDEVKRSSSAYYRVRPFVSKAGQTRIKEVSGVVQMTFPIREVADYAGRSVQTIRLWERRGWIPAPSVQAGKRFYTAAQKELLLELSSLLSSRHSMSSIDFVRALDTVVESIKSRWTLN